MSDREAIDEPPQAPIHPTAVTHKPLGNGRHGRFHHLGHILAVLLLLSQYEDQRNRLFGRATAW
jgi:hypothetical protein